MDSMHYRFWRASTERELGMSARDKDPALDDFVRAHLHLMTFADTQDERTQLTRVANEYCRARTALMHEAMEGMPDAG